MTWQLHVPARRIAGCALLVAALAPAPAGASAHGAVPGISYETVFQDPGPVPGQDLSLERHAIRLIDATPAEEHITFAFRDFNRRPVAEALVAAHHRGVRVDGVIDGGERSQPVVQWLVGELGPTRVVICGAPAFAWHSCITSVDPPSLQHNKFLTFSRLDDGRTHVVLQTSKNFFAPSQLSYYNDMVAIAGDRALHDAYVEYLFDMKAQERSDDRYLVRAGDDGRNTIYPSPRRQAHRDTDDTIVDRMDEIDCAEGGASSGRGLIRVANMAFRSDRAVIMRKLAALARAGCDIEVVLSNADGDIMAGLLSAGIPVHPFLLRAAGTRPAVVVHDKFWLVDARNAVTGTRSRITYAGSSNWRGDQQRSDDLLLRIADDGVFADYLAYWQLIRRRAASDVARPAAEAVAPSSAVGVFPPANDAGWHRSDVTLRIAGSDGHLRTGSSGLKRLHVEMSGAQTGSWDFEGEANGANVQELVVRAEGRTTVTYWSEDNAGNAETPRSSEVAIDRTPPRIDGLPRACELWPPDGRIVAVAEVSASDESSGVDALVVSAGSGEEGDPGDVAVDGGSVRLRAEKAARGAARSYVVQATASDVAGNTSTAAGGCRVPHSRGRPGR